MNEVECHAGGDDALIDCVSVSAAMQYHTWSRIDLNLALTDKFSIKTLGFPWSVCASRCKNVEVKVGILL